MEIKFAQISNSLGTRSLGQKLRLNIESAIFNDDFVVFDFKDVNSISHSFADECFAKLLLSFEIQELKKKSTFKDVNPLIKKVISFTMKERAIQIKKELVK